MKLIDQTPFRTPDGTISPVDKAKATIKFGPSWLGELDAQDAVAAIFKKNLERNFTLFQNYIIPGTELMVPLVLVGQPGVFVFVATNLRGMYRAKGSEWGTVERDRFTPASVNLITRTSRLAASVQKYLEKQGTNVKVEGMLLSLNPGLHVDSVRPAVRVILSDALERFAISINQGQMVMSPEAAQNVATRLQSLRKSAPAAAQVPVPAAKPATQPPTQDDSSYAQQSGSLFRVDDQGRGTESQWSADAFGFQYNEQQEQAESDARAREVQSSTQAESQRVPRPHHSASKKPDSKKKATSKGGFNLTNRQMFALGALFMFWVCILIGFIVWAVLNAA